MSGTDYSVYKLRAGSRALLMACDGAAQGSGVERPVPTPCVQLACGEKLLSKAALLLDGTSWLIFRDPSALRSAVSVKLVHPFPLKPVGTLSPVSMWGTHSGHKACLSRRALLLVQP